jgi:hypothetical protein
MHFALNSQGGASSIMFWLWIHYRAQPTVKFSLFFVLDSGTVNCPFPMHSFRLSVPITLGPLNHNAKELFVLFLDRIVFCCDTWTFFRWHHFLLWHIVFCFFFRSHRFVCTNWFDFYPLVSYVHMDWHKFVVVEVGFWGSSVRGGSEEGNSYARRWYMHFSKTAFYFHFGFFLMGCTQSIFQTLLQQIRLATVSWFRLLVLPSQF